MAENIVDVVESNYDAEVTHSNLPVLLDFWAPWCGPCIALTPMIEKIAAEFQGKVKVVKINLDDSPELARKFGVRSIPNIFMVNKGEVVGHAENASRTRIYALLDDIE